MRDFIHDNFLLKTARGRRLYHEHAAGLPIIDYHCHLDARALAEDRAFENIAQAWVNGDPYKHRAMRIAGVPERCITGAATDREKFECWATTVPQTVGNPLFHWTALELKRFFGIGELLTPASAERIWGACNERLRERGFTARGLIERCNVECVCTSDGLLDDLGAHEALRASGWRVKVLPSLRADDLLNVQSEDYPKWVERLATATGMTIDSFPKLRQAIMNRLDSVDTAGGRLADLAIDDIFFTAADDNLADEMFRKCLSGELKRPAPRSEEYILRGSIMHLLGSECARRGWVMQLHLGAQRQTSTRLRKLAGPAGGYATIGYRCHIESLCKFIDGLEKVERLPRTILYNLNPADNAVLATLTGSFAEDGVRGKIQWGPAWWYNDHALGIRNHLETLASYGVLSAFIGMTTDSRSLLSMVRHEYFRRVLCDWVGEQVEAGAWPDDEGLLGGLVRRVAYENAREWI